MRKRSVIRGYKDLSTSPTDTVLAGIEAAITTYLDGVRASGHEYVVVTFDVQVIGQAGSSG
mgnify:CR=1